MAYSTPNPPDYNLCLEDIEAEMDLIWPQWDALIPRNAPPKPNGDIPMAKGKRWDSLPYPRLARMKWLAKRRMQVKMGLELWGILITHSSKDPLMCYAHPVPPPTEEGIAYPDPPPRIGGEK